MKKEKLNLYILIGSLALTVLFAILTIVYMIKDFHVFSVIALIVDIFAIGVIVYCFMQEKNESEPKVVEAIEEPAEEEDIFAETFVKKEEPATEEVKEEAPVVEETPQEIVEE